MLGTLLQENTGKILTKELDLAINAIEKSFGKNAIMRLGANTRLDVETIPSPSLGIDIALGIGGLPRGRVVEIYGGESSGKTTFTLHVIANAQKTGGETAFIDVEHALDPVYARKLGVNTDDLLISQPDCGEQALEIAEALIKSNSLDVVVVDSVAALVPRAELEGSMGDPQMGLQARLMSQALRKLTAVTAKSKTCLIFINQLRDKIGVMFGSPETTTGGKALKFYASVRLDIRRTQTATDKLSNTVKVKVVKNKLSAPFKEHLCDLYFGEGISAETDLITFGVEKGLVDKSGAWYSYNSQRMGQGLPNAIAFLKEHPEISEKLSSVLRTIYFPKGEK